jgi:pSer/pThr/pTyr-binding forkhead associated (FHA) protein
MTMFKLILKFQDTVLNEYSFDKTPVTIGRRDDNDIVIDNMAVSGHHAAIEEEDPNFYVLVDLESLNGTFLNEKKVVREKVYHGDAIIVGKHSLDFVDMRPEFQRPRKKAADPVPKEKPVYRDTVVLDTKAQQELLARQAAEKGISLEKLAERPKKVDLQASLTIISGGTPQIIELNKRIMKLGKADDADVKCQGLLVGKTAALINKRPNGFFLAYAEGLKKPEVNGESVKAQVQLQDGDEIAVGSTRMTFNLHEEILS